MTVNGRTVAVVRERERRVSKEALSWGWESMVGEGVGWKNQGFVFWRGEEFCVDRYAWVDVWYRHGSLTACCETLDLRRWSLGSGCTVQSMLDGYHLCLVSSRTLSLLRYHPQPAELGQSNLLSKSLQQYVNN